MRSVTKQCAEDNNLHAEYQHRQCLNEMPGLTVATMRMPGYKMAAIWCQDRQWLQWGVRTGSYYNEVPLWAVAMMTMPRYSGYNDNWPNPMSLKKQFESAVNTFSLQQDSLIIKSLRVINLSNILCFRLKWYHGGYVITFGRKAQQSQLKMLEATRFMTMVMWHSLLRNKP